MDGGSILLIGVSLPFIIGAFVLILGTPRALKKEKERREGLNRKKEDLETQIELAEKELRNRKIVTSVDDEEEYI